MLVYYKSNADNQNLNGRNTNQYRFLTINLSSLVKDFFNRSLLKPPKFYQHSIGRDAPVFRAGAPFICWDALGGAEEAMIGAPLYETWNYRQSDYYKI